MERRRSERRSGSGRRPRVAVLAWDVGHNPLGRAYLLADLARRNADVEIWGAQFPAYGSRVWAPVRDGAIPVRSFPGRMFPEHLDEMAAAASRIDADVVWMSKPRLPSLALGLLVHDRTGAGLVLDVDDDELAFFDEVAGLGPEQALRVRDAADLARPYGRTWTRMAVHLAPGFEPVTVSNPVLRERLGGDLVPHARDERSFDPARYDRAEIRRRLGVDDDVRLVLFGGTPRAHKGVGRVLTALDRLGDPRWRLAIFGPADALRAEVGDLADRVIALPYPRFDELAPVVGAADLACVLQDPRHPVSLTQMPAKVTDALAMGVPLLVTDVPPLRPLIDAGLVHAVANDEPLEERMRAVLGDDGTLERSRRGREEFLARYSYGAVAPRVAGLLERVAVDPPPLAPDARAAVDIPRRRFPGARGSAIATAPAPRQPGREVIHPAPDGRYDLVMFWRQNDTTLYGRRQDMLLDALVRSGRFDRVVHFDAPITPEALVQAWRSGANRSDQRRLVVRQTLPRILRRGGARRGAVRHHTYLFGGRWTGRIGLGRRERFPDHVRAVLRRHGFGSRPVVFWVYPAHDAFPAIADELAPDLVVADVVDDQRSWHAPGTADHDRVDRNHEEVLARSDVVLANCEAVAERMTCYAPGVAVVPNAAEASTGDVAGDVPRELRDLPGPIIGYAGNLSSRIDLPLLEAVVQARPEWSFVFLGSAHLDQAALTLATAPNVHFLGVRRYEEAKRFIAHFDVALIPHVDDEMTRSMNPLKGYVYVAAGVPVVATPVANLGELGEAVTVAAGPDDFVGAIVDALARGRREPDPDWLRRHSWDARVEAILRLLDEAAGRPAGVPGEAG